LTVSGLVRLVNHKLLTNGLSKIKSIPETYGLQVCDLRCQGIESKKF